MRVLVAGSHGKIGQRLVRVLARRGHEVIAMIRDAEQAGSVRALGVEPLLADLTGDVSSAPAGCDAVVFAAGAGPGSGPEPKQLVDRRGAEKLADAAAAHGARRFVMVSSVYAHDPDAGPEGLRPYLEAKRQADEHLMASDLDWTVVRPGFLTDVSGEGRIRVTTVPGNRGSVSRDDVAVTLAETLERDALAHVVFELFEGDVPVAQALDRLVSSGGRTR